MINLNAIYVLWLREIRRFLRAKSRVIGMLAMPLMFLAFLGLGFSGMAVPGISGGLDYIRFLVPGIIGMGMLFTSMFAGISVLWDREFGFLKEIMIAPVKRISIVLGRLAGGVTTALLQGVLLLFIAMLVGFQVDSMVAFLTAVVFMILVATTFIGLGLVFASKMKDMQGFSLIMNFVIFPLFFLSGALFPLDNLPAFVKAISYIDPLTYGIDGMRAALIGVSVFPIAIDFAVLLAFSLVMIFLGAYFFEKSESV
jgi:ABC-2 type transport system permease protein